jgi:hypothetical protein
MPFILPVVARRWEDADVADQRSEMAYYYRREKENGLATTFTH